MEASSLKSPTKLDLAHDLDDIDLADDITIENEMQKPPPASILQEETTNTNGNQRLKMTEQLPKLPADGDNLDLYKNIEVDAKRCRSHRDAVESVNA